VVFLFLQRVRIRSLRLGFFPGASSATEQSGDLWCVGLTSNSTFLPTKDRCEQQILPQHSGSIFNTSGIVARNNMGGKLSKVYQAFSAINAPVALTAAPTISPTLMPLLDERMMLDGVQLVVPSGLPVLPMTDIPFLKSR